MTLTAHALRTAFPRRGTDPLDVLRVTFDRSPQAVVVAGGEGTIVFANERALRIFAYTADAVFGMRLSQLLPDLTPPSEDQPADYLTDAEQAAPVATRGIRQDGRIVPLEASLCVFDDGATRCVIASIIDPAERIDADGRSIAATQADLDFQRLIADVAIKLGAAQPDTVDGVIAASLQQMGEALQLDCAALWRWRTGSPDGRSRQSLDQGPYESPESLTTSSIPSVFARLRAGDSCSFATISDLPDLDRAALRRYGLRSAILTPLPSGDAVEPIVTALVLGSTRREQEWAPAIVERLRLIAGVISQALVRDARDLALRTALDQVRRLRDSAVAENAELRRETKVLRSSRPIVSESPAIQQVLALVNQVAPTPATVLLLGETGTGKELMAQAIHELSPRHQRTMIRVSCAAIPTALIESELFGREKGAFTGALSRQIGRFEAAGQSTLFLDEIGELPLEVQVKLLRVLQERVIERLGSPNPIKVDVRIIAATNRNLVDAIGEKTFREDLFYRLNVFPIVVPPLRDRAEDIPALVWSFVDEFSKSFGKTVDSISKDSLRDLQRYPWPGNVRELRNVIERAMIVLTGRHLVVSAPQLGERPAVQSAMTLSELEVGHIRTVLETTAWRVRGPGGAAERLGLKPTTLESRMARLGIVRKRMN